MTFSFGPPNPYKPLLFLAGFAFDAGTRFRTSSLRLLDLAFGFAAYLLVIYPVFFFIIYLTEPAAIKPVLYGLPIHAAIYIGEAVLFAPILWRLFGSDRAPSGVRSIQRQIGAIE